MISENTIADGNITSAIQQEEKPTSVRIRTTANKETEISRELFDEFKNSLRGKLVSPKDAGYDDARKVHNGMIDKRPAMIVQCTCVTGIIASVNFARKNKLLVAVRGAGHNVAGTAVCDEGIVIDLSGMKGIRINPTQHTVRVEPGVTWGELSHDLQFFGLAATGGYVSTTGVSGLTLGGGLGWLLRKHGMALDNLLSIDIVTADGQLVTADATQNEDLFWGVRGGGGNFGIATSFKFKVHPAGTVLAGLVLHPVSKGKKALQNWREFSDKSPIELTGGALVFNPPAELPLPEVLHREGIVAMGGVYTGSLHTGEQALRPLREFGPPTADIFQPMPYSAAQTMADFLWPRGFYNYWKSNFLSELSDEAIDTILKFFATAPSPRTVVVLEHVGDCAMSQIADDETAFGHRNFNFNFLVTSLWTNPEDSEKNIQWTREFYDAMKPFMANAVYLNYIGDEGEERVKQGYGNKYEKLAILKRKYDPENMFCNNQNIVPAKV
ncbi:MAG: FAD-binding oxidoreductase [Bacteroidetes bacterium]|nr:MAG: FAD-binding oxidoreductase [Bacteroidota bacterium]